MSAFKCLTVDLQRVRGGRGYGCGCPGITIAHVSASMLEWDAEIASEADTPHEGAIYRMK